MKFNIVSRQGVLQTADDGTPLANFGFGCVQPLYSPADLQKIEGIQVEISTPAPAGRFASTCRHLT